MRGIAPLPQGLGFFGRGFYAWDGARRVNGYGNDVTDLQPALLQIMEEVKCLSLIHLQRPGKNGLMRAAFGAEITDLELQETRFGVEESNLEVKESGFHTWTRIGSTWQMNGKAKLGGRANTLTFGAIHRFAHHTKISWAIKSNVCRS
jgi:hypothetical protein